MINNRFIIKRKLGDGRSKVFLCSDNDNPEKDYAIKILSESADAGEVKTFRDEFFILQKLNHPNIISSHEEGVVVKTDDEKEINSGSRFIILDYFPGTELLNYKKINDEQTLNIILKQICSVLYYLHQSNYIYYDLKQENILVSEPDGKPFIKLIDMGFAHHSSSGDGYLSRGTREYIAPEILKKESHNHQVDLYSLGIMLYRIVYGKFPFKSELELEIYKEHIEREFEFAQSNYSPELIAIVKELVEKKPVNRFDNALQVLKNIKTDIGQDIIKYFTPANVFADREEVVSQIKNYLTENRNKEVIILSGAEGSGKTSLVYKIYSDYEKTILIGKTERKTSIAFVQYLLKKTIFSEFVYLFLSKDIIEQADLIFSGSSENLISNLKSIFTRISAEIKFNIIIDDFNLLDEFTLDVFNEILPILQVNGINIILTERSDHPEAAGKIISKAQVINLTPFTENDLNEYLDTALATFFPKDQLKKLIIKYADLLPGSIINFIRDLILLNVIIFTHDGPEIIEDEKTEKLLESSHEEIFRLRFSLLMPGEIKVAQLISSFKNLPEVNVIGSLTGFSNEEVFGIIKRLEEKNILQVSNIEKTIAFTSESLKKYVYQVIDNKEDYHIKSADSISEHFKNFNRNELARQYELGNNFISSYKILSEEIDDAERLSAYSYKKNILNHLLTLKLPEEYKTESGYKLSLTLYKLNDAKSALSIIEDLLTKSINEIIKTELLILKGSCLIELGQLDEGKNLLNHLVKKISDEERKQKLLVEIAYAEFDLGKYEVSEDYVKRIIENDYTSVEEKAKCHNLLGLIEIYQRNNLDNAVREFEKSLEYYKQINSILQEAKIERNIGNIYNMKGEYSSAEKFWNSAHEKNLSIGNLDQEAKHLLNYGIYYYELGLFDEATKQYTQANEIFSILGNRHGECLALTNLGEVNLEICNYQEAYNSLIKAKRIFSTLSNIEEKGEVMFFLGKLFSILGDKEELDKIIKEYNELVSESSERHTNHIKFLQYLFVDNYDERLIAEIKNKYRELNDRTNFVKTNILLCENFINNKKYVEAFDIINEKEFLEVCGKNSIIRAYREFLIGEISTKSEKLNIPNPFNCYYKAYEILKDNYVTELTWKLLLKLGEIYYERGNFIKAEEYIVYAKKLLYFIADRITETELKEKYLMNPERERAIKRLDLLEKELS